MAVHRHVIEMTTSSGGAASGATASIAGAIDSIRVVGFDGSADIVVTAAGRPILTKTGIDADEYFAPRMPVHAAADGAAITGGFAPALLAGDKISVAIANGGNAQSGRVEIITYDP